MTSPTYLRDTMESVRAGIRPVSEDALPLARLALRYDVAGALRPLPSRLTKFAMRALRGECNEIRDELARRRAAREATFTPDEKGAA